MYIKGLGAAALSHCVYIEQSKIAMGIEFEKYLLPVFLLVFQAVFILLYGLLVRYDDTGNPHTNVTAAKAISGLESSKSTLKVYPCKYA